MCRSFIFMSAELRPSCSGGGGLGEMGTPVGRWVGRVGAGWVACIGRLWGVCLCTDVSSNPHFPFLFCCLFSSWIIPVSGLQHVFNLLHSKYTKHQKLIQAGYHMNSLRILVFMIQYRSICYTHLLYIFSHPYTAAPPESTDSCIRQLWNIALRTNLSRNPLITNFKGSKCFSGLCGGPLSRVHAMQTHCQLSSGQIPVSSVILRCKLCDKGQKTNIKNVYGISHI